MEPNARSRRAHGLGDSAISQIIGIAILEFGVLLHSVLIGLTLAVDEDFIILFVVLIFHQTFEGLGVGSRLAFIPLPDKYRHVPTIAAIVYGLSTPIGIAAGLGVRQTYNPESQTASIVSGVMDSISAGILLYTGLVEVRIAKHLEHTTLALISSLQLLAHEFLFNKQMIEGSNGRLAYAIGCMCLGCGLMALLGRWA
jgi:solute carrier family 39 (zinc transporter), member 1/2/3